MEPYVGEIRVFTCNFVPTGWLSCNGDTLQITSNAALYALLGTKFGGNGSTTFMLPDLRGAAMLSQGVSGGVTYQVGNTGGTETVALTTTTMPTHNHTLAGVNINAGYPLINNSPFELIAQPVSGSDTVVAYISPGAVPAPTIVPLQASTLAITGAATPHNNMPPFQTLNVCICTTGYFPPRN